MKPTALIVGGRGFVGQHLARKLADRYSVVLTGRDNDIRDRDGVRRLVEQTKPAMVVDLAAVTTVKEAFDCPRRAYEVGFLGLLHLFEALDACRFGGRVLFVSSSEVYGFPASDELPLTEASPLRPMSPYAVAKIAGEALCRQWNAVGGLEIVIARPFTHIGPGQSDRFAVARFSRQLAEIMCGRRERTLHVGALQTTRDLTDVRDVVRAYDLLLHRGEPGGVYNICSEREVAMRDVLAELIDIAAVEIEIVEEVSLTRKSEQQRVCGSYSALRAATGWSPRIPLTRTLADILKDQQARSDVSAGAA